MAREQFIGGVLAFCRDEEAHHEKLARAAAGQVLADLER